DPLSNFFPLPSPFSSLSPLPTAPPPLFRSTAAAYLTLTSAALALASAATYLAVDRRVSALAGLLFLAAWAASRALAACLGFAASWSTPLPPRPSPAASERCGVPRTALDAAGGLDPARPPLRHGPWCWTRPLPPVTPRRPRRRLPLPTMRIRRKAKGETRCRATSSPPPSVGRTMRQ
ncbi:hypothetical protein SETIT_9G350500v2, partial [Setaria italica]